MNEQKFAVRGVSDTARWVAYFRALETLRPNALFRDPYAKRLAGDHGFRLANTLAQGNKQEWAWVMRTYLFDRFLAEAIGEGADLVVNLAAGLDARPYRMDLPESLQWIEVDFQEIIDYKKEVLADAKPRCRLERISLDLADLALRRAILAQFDERATKAVIATEGLLIYFSPDEVASLAADLAAQTHFQTWIIDLASPGQLRLMQRTTGKQLSEAGAAFKFGPADGVNFFVPFGWEPAEVQGMLKTAAEFKRAPDELLPLLPEPKGNPGNYPWTGVCKLKKRHP